jgi:hypothetical protein
MTGWGMQSNEFPVKRATKKELAQALFELVDKKGCEIVSPPQEITRTRYDLGKYDYKYGRHGASTWANDTYWIAKVRKVSK